MRRMAFRDSATTVDISVLLDVMCEVIGCQERADWRLVNRPNNFCEDYLCSHHWTELQCYRPAIGECYSALIVSMARDADTISPEEMRGKIHHYQLEKLRRAGTGTP